MNSETLSASTAATLERSVDDRDAELTGAVRCGAYGLYSALMASPHDIDVEEQVRGATNVLGTHPYGIDFTALIDAYLSRTQTRRKREYSELFEVGDSVPPVPIREQQEFNYLAGIREDLLRFYDFFEYTLHQRYAWAPDHISVLLEFCSLLSYRESTACEERMSCQLAQLDFVSRHLLRWAPVFADRVSTVSARSVYAAVARSLCDFVSRDYEWQVSTVVTTSRSGGRG